MQAIGVSVGHSGLHRSAHFGFVSLSVGLNQNLSDPDVLKHVTQRLFHSLAGSEYRDSADLLAIDSLAIVSAVLRRHYHHILNGDQCD